MKILNLDDFVPEDKSFVLGGKKYFIPGNLPFEVWLRLMKYTQESAVGDMEQTEKAFETLADIIKIRSPEVTKKDLSMLLSIKQYMELIKFLFESETETIQESAQEEKKTSSVGG